MDHKNEDNRKNEDDFNIEDNLKNYNFSLNFSESGLPPNSLNQKWTQFQKLR